MRGGMSNTGRKYSLTFSAQALNLFNDIDYGTPTGSVVPTLLSGSGATAEYGRAAGSIGRRAWRGGCLRLHRGLRHGGSSFRRRSRSEVTSPLSRIRDRGHPQAYGCPSYPPLPHPIGFCKEVVHFQWFRARLRG